MAAASSSLCRRFLSIDIGIRNLGVSVIEYEFDTSIDTNGKLSNTSWQKLVISQLELIDVVEASQADKKKRPNAKPKNAKTVNIHELCQGIVKLFLSREAWLRDVTDVRVEQQPIMRGKYGGGNSLGSVRMKIIQHCLLTFFDTYYTLHPELPKPRISPTSPANKLKCVLRADDFSTAPLSATDKNTDYKQRKDKSVDMFNNVVGWCTIRPELLNQYQELKKQNDLADCVLQAVFELQEFGSGLRHKHETKKRKRAKKVTPETKQENSDVLPVVTAPVKKRKRKLTEIEAAAEITAEHDVIIPPKKQRKPAANKAPTKPRKKKVKIAEVQHAQSGDVLMSETLNI
jgi:hypothetical protein